MTRELRFSLDQIKDEFRIWTQAVKPELSLPENILGICEYGVTEVINNVIDHAGATTLSISVNSTPEGVALDISDDGEGIFHKLRTYFGFDSDLHALIELVKGKLTVAPEFHSGEGLFFASKMFDCFVIESGELTVTFRDESCTVALGAPRKGTRVRMEITSASPRRAEEVFSRYCEAESLSFSKTRLALSLAALEGGLVSRSQAKRIAARLENFREVELDFTDVASAGQGFIDELFRVWPLSHPQTSLIPTHANEKVSAMLSHVRTRSDLPQPDIRPQSKGFTLTELAVVLVIVSLLIGGMLIPLSTQTDMRSVDETQKSLSDIREALLGFAISNGRLPCPADVTKITGVDADAGSESKTVTGCNSTAGALPWSTLGVSETDAWGHRYSYRVTLEFAREIGQTSFSGCPSGQPSSNPQFAAFALCSQGDTTIRDGVSIIATNLPAVVVSHGKNGNGAYVNLTTEVRQLDTGSDADELDNQLTGGGTTMANAQFVSKTPTPTFDDQVIWLSPNILFNRMITAGKLP